MNLFPMTQTAALMGQLIDTKTSTVPIIEMNSFKPEFDPEIHSTRLERCKPEEEGISSVLISEFLHTLKRDRTLNMHSVTVARNGKILCEAAFGAQRLDIWKHAFSASKSVTSLAIGMLIDEGLLTLDEKVVSIFRDEANAVARIKLKDMCVEDLLTMRSTVLFAEADSMTEVDWVRAFLSASTKGDVGETFRYNSLNTYMLSAIVSKKTGMPMSEYLKPRLFEPLGIRDYFWEKCPKGIDIGGWGLYIRPEDFVKIATLVQNGGEYNGNRLVSEEYVNMATVKHVDIGWESERFDYGYQIWIGKNANTYLFNGMLGQNVICFKDSGIVIVTNAGNSDMFQQSSFFEYAENFFDREFPVKIEANPKAYEMLCKQISGFSLYNDRNKKSIFKRIFGVFSSSPLTAKFELIDGKEYVVAEGEGKATGILPLVIQSVENCYSKGFFGLAFSRDEQGSPVMTYRENEAEFEIPLGFDTPKSTNIKYRNENFLISCKAKFTYNEVDDPVLVVRLDFLETPSSRIIKIYFYGEDSVLVEQTETPGADFMQGLTDMVVTQMVGNPLLGAVYEKFGAELIDYKIEQIFNSKLTLKLK